MEQIAVSFTDGWVPKTWLTPKVTILDKGGNVYIQDWELKELWYGWYIYNFDKYSPEKVYLYIFDWWDELEGYDRYIYGWNELDAYSNKYSWGRTAAPYFTQFSDWLSWRFDKSDKLIKALEKKIKNYDDKNLKMELEDFKKVMRGKYVDTNNRLDELWNMLEEIKQSVVDTSATNDWNSSKNFSGINGKLDLLAEYITQFKWDMNDELNMLDDNVANRIIESNLNLSGDISNMATVQQLSDEVKKLEGQLNKLLDAIVSDKLPREIRDEYDVNVKRRQDELSDEDLMNALWVPMEEEWMSMDVNYGNQYWLNQWMSEGIEMWMEEWMNTWMDEWLWTAREAWLNAPVDMQGIAEPEMPMWPL